MDVTLLTIHRLVQSTSLISTSLIFSEFPRGRSFTEGI